MATRTLLMDEPVVPDEPAPAPRALRHDLLNAINVLIGATAGLRGGALTDSQGAWVKMIESATGRVAAVADTLGRDDRAHAEAGQARFADLCSIAAARVAKPFDRRRLLDAIEAV